MGHGYDETGTKGVLLLALDEKVQAEFVPLNVPLFFDETVDVGADAAQTLANLLPGVESEHFYRVTFTGYSENLDLAVLTAQFSHIRNLELRDKTIPEKSLWSAVGEDSLEGMFFSILQEGLDTQDERQRRCIKLAAQISRQILDGQEVQLP